MEEFLKKLKELMDAYKIDEDKAKEVLKTLGIEPEEEKEPEKPVEEEGKAEKEVLPPSSEKEENPTPIEEGAPTGEDPVNEGEVPVEEVPPQPQEEVVPPVEEVPPTNVPQEGEVPPAPPIDIEGLVAKFDEQKGIIEEQAKTIEGLGARIQSLEDALKSAGVLEKGEGEDVGIHNSNVPPSGSNGAVNDMTNVLAKLNGNKHF